MSTQPEALRLADYFMEFGGMNDQLAAAELRRLHEVNAELLGACRYAVAAVAWAAESDLAFEDSYSRLDAAIAKATGGEV